MSASGARATQVPLVLRADAGSALGMGHLMRCLALAEAWEDAGNDSVFVSVDLPDELKARVTGSGRIVNQLSETTGSAEDAAETLATATRIGARWIVVDGYQFSPDYVRTLKETGVCVLQIDDEGMEDRVWADVILNQNIHADPRLYARSGDSRLLLGNDFALVRKEFRAIDRGQDFARANVLVTLGGSPDPRALLEVADAVARVADPELRCKIVGGWRADDARYSFAPDARFELAGSTDDMPALMDWATVAISAAGSTCWELCFLGVPQVLITFAENQKPIAAGLEEKGCAVNTGDLSAASKSLITKAVEDLLGDRERLVKMSERCHDVVDGLGARRVTSVLEEIPCHR